MPTPVPVTPPPAQKEVKQPPPQLPLDAEVEQIKKAAAISLVIETVFNVTLRDQQSNLLFLHNLAKGSTTKYLEIHDIDSIIMEVVEMLNRQSSRPSASSAIKGSIVLFLVLIKKKGLTEFQYLITSFKRATKYSYLKTGNLNSCVSPFLKMPKLLKS